MNINSSTKLICLLGQPVKQSFSPSIHNYLSEKYEKNNAYMCFEVERGDLKSAVEGMKAFKVKGCNVTIPHKVDIIQYLDEVDKNAKLIGAVNTIKNNDGKLIGYNTDGIGFVKSLLDVCSNLKSKKIMIIGAGGACRSIAVELANKNVDSIELRNRSEANAKIISDLINTTPIGMNSSQCPIDKNIKPHQNLIVCDIVYKPHETELLKWANNHQLKVVYGINMLINQGLLAYEIWENIKTEEDTEKIKEIYFKTLK